MVKLQKVKNGWHITVPAQTVKLKQWQKGKELAWIVSEKGDLILKEFPKQ